jgi:hypothetical protein
LPNVFALIKFAPPRPLFALPQTFIPLSPQNLYLRRTWWWQLVAGNVLSAHRGRQLVNKAKEIVIAQVVRASASACRWSAAQADMRTHTLVDRCTLCQYPSTFVSVLATKRSETFFCSKVGSWSLKNSNQPAPILQGNCAVRNHLKTIQ